MRLLIQGKRADSCNCSLEWPMLQFESQLPADPREVSLYLPRAGQGCLNMRQYILITDMLAKVGLRDESRRLIPRTAKQKRLACFAETIRELLKRVHAGGVKRCHIAKAQ